jgi:hypothetical protein
MLKNFTLVVGNSRKKFIFGKCLVKNIESVGPNPKEIKSVDFVFLMTFNEISELPELILNKVKHFFERYKDLEKGKWVKVTGYKDSIGAKKKISEAMERAKK